MTQVKNFFAQNKEVIFLGVLVIAIIVVEGFGFNREFVSGYLSGPQERPYSINDATLYQFSLENGKLVAQSGDPNITFDNLNLMVSSITINCNNSMASTPGAFGQIFYNSNSNEPFSEANSMRYDLSAGNKVFALPKAQTVYSIRFDLTNIPHDSITCGDIMIDYLPTFQLDTKRLAVYIGLVLLALLLFIIKSINPDKNFSEGTLSESDNLPEEQAILAMKTFIQAKHISVRFRIYHNPIPSLKDLVVNWVSGKKNRDNFTEFFALNDISLTIKPGDRLGIIGLNGAGKSTLLKTIAGIYSPHQGRISVSGRMTPLMELGAGFDNEQTGRENIFLNGALLGFSPTQMREREQAIADFSELGEFLDLPVKYYSTGMYSRLAFSIATMTNPEILLIDEVFAAGDAHFVEKSSQRILQLVEQSQIVIIVSHSLEQIKKLCNRVIVMNKGIIVKDANPDEALAYYTENIINHA